MENGNIRKLAGGFKWKQIALWVGALVLGAILGSLGCKGLNEFFDFVASAYTRCFQFVAVPTVALAILTAMASLGEGRAMGKVFARTFSYTVLTSFLAALVGLGLYLLVNPGSIDPNAIAAVSKDAAAMAQISKAPDTVYGHILNAIPNNLVGPFLSGNVLPVVLISAAIGDLIPAAFLALIAAKRGQQIGGHTDHFIATGNILGQEIQIIEDGYADPTGGTAPKAR